MNNKELGRKAIEYTRKNGIYKNLYAIQTAYIDGAKMALKQGMSNEEISSFLSGGDQFIQPEEAKAIFFAQHFADARGIPKAYAYDALVKEYGAKKAEIILCVSEAGLNCWAALTSSSKFSSLF